MPVELRNDRTQERDVVLFDLVVVAFVGDAQTQRRAVEFQRYDGLEPLLELFRRNAGFDGVEAVLPYFIVCLCIGEHGKNALNFQHRKVVNNFIKISPDLSWKISFFHYGKWAVSGHDFLSA